jgi:hypothetical protein
MSKPAPQPRPMGGFNSSLGNFDDEHLEANAMQNALGQKALSQQSAQLTPQQMQQAAAQQQASQAQQTPETSQEKPREVGTFTEELIKRPVKDIIRGLKSIFDLNDLLGVKSSADDPQSLAKKKQMLQRFNKLNQEQQAIARQKYQAELKKKQQAEQEAEMKRRQEAQQKQQSISVPSGPQKGPVGPGSQKPKAVQKLEQDRKTLGGPQSAN